MLPCQYLWELEFHRLTLPTLRRRRRHRRVQSVDVHDVLWLVFAAGFWLRWCVGSESLACARLRITRVRTVGDKENALLKQASKQASSGRLSDSLQEGGRNEDMEESRRVGTERRHNESPFEPATRPRAEVEFVSELP